MIPQDQFIDQLADLLAEATGKPKAQLHGALMEKAQAVAAYRALPTSQDALAKAKLKRQRKAARLAQQLGR